MNCVSQLWDPIKAVLDHQVKTVRRTVYVNRARLQLFDARLYSFD